MSVCPRCRTRGKTWDGDDPRCAFATGTFVARNWNCATMGAIRDLAEHPAVTKQHANESTTVVLELGEDCEAGDFLIVNWYKRRGATPLAFVIDSGDLVELTLERAEECIGVLEMRLHGVVPTPPELRS